MGGMAANKPDTTILHLHKGEAEMPPKTRPEQEIGTAQDLLGPTSRLASIFQHRTKRGSLCCETASPEAGISQAATVGTRKVHQT